MASSLKVAANCELYNLPVRIRQLNGSMGTIENAVRRVLTASGIPGKVSFNGRNMFYEDGDDCHDIAYINVSAISDVRTLAVPLKLSPNLAHVRNELEKAVAAWTPPPRV